MFISGEFFLVWAVWENTGVRLKRRTRKIQQITIPFAESSVKQVVEFIIVNTKNYAKVDSKVVIANVLLKSSRCNLLEWYKHMGYVGSKGRSDWNCGEGNWREGRYQGPSVLLRKLTSEKAKHCLVFGWIYGR